MLGRLLNSEPGDKGGSVMVRTGKMLWCALAVLVVLAAGSGLCGASADPMAGVPWDAQLRPGVFAGLGDAEPGVDGFLDFFMPFWGNERHLLYVNPTLRMDDNSGEEFNLGLGYRGLFGRGAWILGANFYYDHIETEQSNGFNQLGFGVEALSRRLDLRANYYAPVGDDTREAAGNGGYSFSSTSITLVEGYEEALEGVDGEVGVLVPYVSDYMETRLYVGGYYYDSDVGDGYEGLKTRLEFRPGKYISLNFEIRDDNDRGTDMFLGGWISLPISLFGGGPAFEKTGRVFQLGGGPRTMQERMTEKVIRDRHITTRVHGSRDGEKVADVIYVNEDNPNPGDGSLENPYRDIMDAQNSPRYKNGAYIYVFSSDGHADTYDNVHLSLLDDMVLWGQGYRHPVFKLGGDGPNPILDGGGTGNVVTLAENNEIMGLTLQNGANGIYGSGISRTYIHHNLIRANPGFDSGMESFHAAIPASGIHIENTTTGSTGDFSGITRSYRIEYNDIRDNNGAGVYLANVLWTTGALEDVDLSARIVGNTVTGNRIGVVINNQLVGGSLRDAVVTNTLEGNTITAGRALVAGNLDVNGLEPLDGTGVVLATGLGAVRDDTAPGDVIAVAEDVRIANTLEANTVTANDGHGVQMANVIGAAAYSESSDTPVIFSARVARAQIRNVFTGNVLSDNTGDGVYGALVVGLRAVLDFSEFNNTISSRAMVDGAATSLMAAAEDVTIENVFVSNRMDRNQGAGMARTGAYLANVIDVAASHGEGEVSGSVTADLSGADIANTFTGNRALDNVGAGMELDNRIGVDSISGDDGVVQGSLVASAAAVSIANGFEDNVSKGNDYGLRLWNSVDAHVWALDSSTVEGDVSASLEGAVVEDEMTGNEFSQNNDWGANLDSTVEASTLSDATATIEGDSTSRITNGLISSTVKNNRIVGNGDDGLALDLDSDTGTLARALLEGNTVTDNDGYGVFLSGSGGSFTGDLGGGAQTEKRGQVNNA